MECKWWTGREHVRVAFFLVALALTALPVSSAQEKFAAKPATDVQALVQGNNEFAFDLYARLADKKGNVFFSPYSISNALAITYAGARGETASQMAKTLHFTLDQDRLHAAFADLIGQLSGEKKEEKARPYRLHVANALWGQDGFPFLDSFAAVARDQHRAGVAELDFKREPEEARKIINAWVEEKTQKMIKDPLFKSDVDEKTRFVLTNAIYFKANWKYAFPEFLTKNVPFEVTPSEKPAVPMMLTNHGWFKYHSGTEFHVVELPYKGDRLSMVVILPKNRHGLAEVQRKFTGEMLKETLSRMILHQGQVELPRFTIASRASLGTELVQLGMVAAFSNEADFSGMIKGENLALSKVIHQACIAVDEVGTEAAGSTAVTGRLLIGGRDFSFTADHPFLFLIRDIETGSILFVGRVEDPRAR